MSILYAASVLVDGVQRGAYQGWCDEHVWLYDPALECARDPRKAVIGVEQFLVSHRPAVVGIGTTSHALYWALEIARTIKRWRQDCVVVLGGPHEDEQGAIRVGGSISDYSDVVDFSIQGDAEFLFDHLFRVLVCREFDLWGAKESLLRDGSVFAKMQGSGAISFRAADQVHTMAIGRSYKPGLRKRSQVPLDLDALPIAPRWLLTSEHEYAFDVFTSNGRLKRTAQMLATRGCDFGCNFCTERGAVSHRGVSGIMHEIQELAKSGYEVVFFDDSTFHRYRYLGDLLNELTEARDELRMEFGCLTRVDTLLDSQSQLPLGRFADAGFNYFYIGIEHDDDDVLRAMHKGYDRRKIHECLNLFRDLSISFRLGVSLLFGFSPAESEESRRRTLELVAEHPAIVIANLSIVTTHPATLSGRGAKQTLRYDMPAPNCAPEWDLFEEGRWFHPSHVTIEYARGIHRLVREVDRKTGGNLIPKLKRGGNVLGLREPKPSGGSFAELRGLPETREEGVVRFRK